VPEPSFRRRASSSRPRGRCGRDLAVEPRVGRSSDPPRRTDSRTASPPPRPPCARGRAPIAPPPACPSLQARTRSSRRRPPRVVFPGRSRIQNIGVKRTQESLPNGRVPSGKIEFPIRVPERLVYATNRGSLRVDPRSRNRVASEIPTRTTISSGNRHTHNQSTVYRGLNGQNRSIYSPKGTLSQMPVQGFARSAQRDSQIGVLGETFGAISASGVEDTIRLE
jgi:hypothetical protein